MRNEPLLPGPAGWVSQDQPPLFDPERAAPLDWTVRHIPATLRVLGALSAVGPPRLDEERGYAAVRTLTDDHVRRNPTSKRVMAHAPPEAQHLVSWLRCVPFAVRWWKSPYGWRAPREFPGWRDTENGRPHLEPHEIGQMRLPEDLVLDADVVMLQAWCQGFVPRWVIQADIPKDHVWFDYTKCFHDGLRKLHFSPFVQLAIAAPFMPPVGLDLGPGIIETAVRWAQLAKNPYLASLGELEIILRSPIFIEAYTKAQRRRKEGRFVNPNGGWYACGSAASLGTWYRRGARWTPRGPSKRTRGTR